MPSHISRFLPVRVVIATWPRSPPRDYSGERLIDLATLRLNNVSALNRRPPRPAPGKRLANSDNQNVGLIDHPMGAGHANAEEIRDRCSISTLVRSEISHARSDPSRLATSPNIRTPLIVC